MNRRGFVSSLVPVPWVAASTGSIVENSMPGKGRSGETSHQGNRVGMESDGSWDWGNAVQERLPSEDNQENSASGPIIYGGLPDWMICEKHGRDSMEVVNVYLNMMVEWECIQCDIQKGTITFGENPQQ